ncbi:12945_t:CDS:2 [Ambispora leptoticha]|uniref:12945_t:CDS:1 n=1 Tax=Ambispora leptoticha TaxID=144679 RepID=A0A9N8ZJN2_9GLOM|nr:12945_t:CDS:2 [Ambispora leptoticha]
MNNNNPLQITPVTGFNAHHSHYAVTKQRHYAALNLQLEHLQVNMAKLEKHVETTAERLRMIENFGIAQGALFMASNRVLGPRESNDL